MGVCGREMMVKEFVFIAVKVVKGFVFIAVNVVKEFGCSPEGWNAVSCDGFSVPTCRVQKPIPGPEFTSKENRKPSHEKVTLLRAQPSRTENRRMKR